jgi:hypothetical protein
LLANKPNQQGVGRGKGGWIRGRGCSQVASEIKKENLLKIRGI